ncbi:F-box/kelch-repeat protein [Quillaja saponaria]|uniref:F-box/kelch-repeat protein n=1 Tax=Quillaja saponaria TaxID=32244 RepID=A0AAD7PJM7_QUISA|nr:F-box/kelch-repeat protein [Quillaja saponaria]KAJ7958033.1 F-box/kelch-repeat protein [Quillaja saponaria]
MDACKSNCNLIATRVWNIVKMDKIDPPPKVGRGCFSCLCCLPSDLLVLISMRLSVLDYICCRSVCRCWRSAFSQLQFSFSRRPWVIFLRVDKDKEKELHILSLVEKLKVSSFLTPVVYTIGKVGDPLTGRVYNIPELSGKRFLLSKYGWLLLFSSMDCSSSNPSLFFFNPFLQSIIDLPFIDVSCLKQPVFSITAPPTSRDCTMFLISCCDEIASNKIKICIWQHGEDKWNSMTFRHGDLKIPYVINIVFVKGIFYCFHAGGHLSAFNVSNCSWSYLLGPEDFYMREYPYDSTHVSFEFHCSGDVFICMDSDTSHVRPMVKLKDPPEVTLWNWEFKNKWILPLELLRSNPKKAISIENNLVLDSFNLSSWYGICECPEDGLKFKLQSRKFWRSYNLSRGLCTTIAWIEPRLA